MADAILKGCVNEVRSYAKTQGVELSCAQTYEIVARARGFQNANVLAGQYSKKPTAVVPAAPLPPPQKSSLDEPVQYTIRVQNISTYKILEIGNTRLTLDHLKRNVDGASFKPGRSTISVILPIPIDTPVTPRTVAELLFGHSDILTKCEVMTTNYPYGKYHRSYYVTGTPFSYDLPAEDNMGSRLGHAHTLDGLISYCQANPTADFSIGYGFSELDWKVGSHAAIQKAPLSDVESHKPYFCVSRPGQELWVLSTEEFATMKHLVGCYYELTTGIHEGMRIAFYA